MRLRRRVFTVTPPPTHPFLFTMSKSRPAPSPASRCGQPVRSAGTGLIRLPRVPVKPPLRGPQAGGVFGAPSPAESDTIAHRTMASRWVVRDAAPLDDVCVDDATCGWAHIGVLRGLEAAGIVPDVNLCGTSVGARVGGAYLSGHLDVLEEWARNLNKIRILRYLDFKLGGGFIDGERLITLLRDDIGDLRIEDLSPSFATIATELAAGHKVWFPQRFPGRGDARVLRDAGSVPASQGGRRVAGRRRPGQPGACLRVPGHGRAHGYRHQSQRRYHRQGRPPR